MKEQIKLSGDNNEIPTGTANENALQITYPAYAIDGVRGSLSEADKGELISYIGVRDMLATD